MSHKLKLLRLAIAVSLAGAFLISGVKHLDSPYLFLQSVLDYDLIKRDISWLVATVLMCSNIVVAAAIISHKFEGVVYYAALALLTIYLLAQLIAVARGLEIGCGCFGPASKLIGAQSILLTFTFWCMALLMVLSDGRKSAHPQEPN